MSEKVKYVLNAGAIIGLAYGVLPSFGMLILPVGLFFTIKKYRINYLEDVITYGTVLKIGFRLSVLAGIVIAFANLMWFYFAPQKVSKIMNDVFAMMETMGYPTHILDQAQQNQVQIFCFSGFLNTIMMGFLVSLILGFILKKEPTTPEQL